MIILESWFEQNKRKTRKRTYHYCANSKALPAQIRATSYGNGRCSPPGPRTIAPVSWWRISGRPSPSAGTSSSRAEWITTGEKEVKKQTTFSGFTIAQLTTTHMLTTTLAHTIVTDRTGCILIWLTLLTLDLKCKIMQRASSRTHPCWWIIGIFFFLKASVTHDAHVGTANGEMGWIHSLFTLNIETPSQYMRYQ